MRDSSDLSNSSSYAKFQPKAIVATIEQLKIQTTTEQTVVVEANAGAAKTTTLALRIAESWSRGISPELILALTYTQTACEALKAALQKIGMPHSIIIRFRIRTFEEFCTQVLDEILSARVRVIKQAELLKPFVWQAVKRVENNAGERWRSELLMPSLSDNGIVEDFLKTDNWLKGTMRDVIAREDNAVTPDYAEFVGIEYTQLKIFLAYQKIRKPEFAKEPLFRGVSDATYDLAGMLFEEEDMDGLEAWPSSLKVLIVDEMHDMNQAMFMVLRALLNSTSCFFCGVGDSDQVIHEITGADARFMGSEITASTGRKVTRYPLTHSYRFGRSLAIKAGRIADKPYSSMAAHETKVTLLDYSDNEDCARKVVEQASHWRGRSRVKQDQFAILLRHNCQSIQIENELLAQDISYTMRGMESYLMRPEILFVRGLLAVAIDDLKSVSANNTRKKVMQALLLFSGSTIEVEGRETESQETLLASAIKTVTEVPSFLTDFFKNHVLRNAEPLVRHRLEAGIAVAREHSGADLLKRVLDALNIKSLVREVFVSKQRQQDAMDNLAGIDYASRFFKSARDYFNFLNDAEQKHLLHLKPSSNVLIASIDDVKGLEFDHVAIPYLERGVFPGPNGLIKEEQNMFYVAMTRARRDLTIFVKTGSPSSFVIKAGYKSIQEVQI
jgi:DNA helicase II / ATP-dependent DNA helicase PcrA